MADDAKVVEWPGGDDEREAGSGDSGVTAAEAERKATQRQAKVTVVIVTLSQSIWPTRGPDGAYLHQHSHVCRPPVADKTSQGRTGAASPL